MTNFIRQIAINAKIMYILAVMNGAKYIRHIPITRTNCINLSKIKHLYDMCAVKYTFKEQDSFSN